MITEFFHYECEKVNSTEAHDELLDKVCDMEKVIHAMLDDSAYKKFMEYSNLTFEFACEMRKTGYIAGFKAGMQLGVEVFEHNI